MNRKIKLIGLDLDGTLLTTKKEVTPYTKKVIEMAIEEGTEVVVSTGRPISYVPREVLNIPGMKYAVTTNGAKVFDLRTGEVLSERILSMETTLSLIRILEGYDAVLEIFLGDISFARSRELSHVYDYFESPDMAEYVKSTRVPVQNLKETLLEKQMGADKVHIIFRDPKEKQEANEKLKEVSGIVVAESFGNNLEINREGTNKGVGLLMLGELLHISREEIMACGDGMNDFEMLKTVGFSVAMANGHRSVKEIADYVTDTNDEDGVAKAICRFVLKTGGKEIIC